VRHLDRVLTQVENVLAAGALAAATLLAVAGVILRYFFSYVIFWGEELTIYLILFSTFIGAVVTLRHNEHVNVDILPTLIRRARRGFALLAGLLVVVYCAVIGFYAWEMVFSPIARNTTTAALRVPLWAVQFVLPVGLTLMLLRSLEMLWRVARGGELPGHAEVGAVTEVEAIATADSGGPGVKR
jgi:TRAP-type C4-dicarboxylate transport system permease small subunit